MCIVKVAHIWLGRRNISLRQRSKLSFTKEESSGHAYVTVIRRVNICIQCYLSCRTNHYSSVTNILKTSLHQHAQCRCLELLCNQISNPKTDPEAESRNSFSILRQCGKKRDIYSRVSWLDPAFWLYANNRGSNPVPLLRIVSSRYDLYGYY